MQQSDIVHSKISSHQKALYSSTLDSTRRFTEFYRRYRGVVCTYLYSHRVPSHAIDDLVQEVFVTAYQKRDCLHAKSAAFAWLAAIARYKVINYRRSDRRRDRKLEALAHEPRTNEDGDRMPERLVTQSLVRRYLSQLGQARLEVLVYAEIYGLSSVEISELTKVNPNTIRARLTAARRQLRKLALKLDPEHVVQVEHSLLMSAADESGGGSEKTESSLKSLLPLLAAGSLTGVSCAIDNAAGFGLESGMAGTSSQNGVSLMSETGASPRPLGRSGVGQHESSRVSEAEEGLEILSHSSRANAALGKVGGATIETSAMFSKGLAFGGWKGVLGVCVSVLAGIFIFLRGGSEIESKDRVEFPVVQTPNAPLLEPPNPKISLPVHPPEKLNVEAVITMDEPGRLEVASANIVSSKKVGNLAEAGFIRAKLPMKIPSSDQIRGLAGIGKLENRIISGITAGHSKLEKEKSVKVSSEKKRRSAGNKDGEVLSPKNRSRPESKKTKSDSIDSFSRELALLQRAEKCEARRRILGRTEFWSRIRNCGKWLRKYDREFASNGQMVEVRQRL